MLADSLTEAASGAFDTNLHQPATFFRVVIDFIASQLPLWRDDPLRPVVAAETALTAQLCRFLNHATRRANLDHIVFQTEVPDAVAPSRTLDLAPAPVGKPIWIGERRYGYYDSLIPIECKRLPTPKRKKPERREYLYTLNGRKGGVQRFKEELHGGDHENGAVIAYVETQTNAAWFNTVNRWVGGLVRRSVQNWAATDKLALLRNDQAGRVLLAQSCNSRKSRGAITLWHIWIEMK